MTSHLLTRPMRTRRTLRLAAAALSLSGLAGACAVGDHDTGSDTTDTPDTAAPVSETAATSPTLPTIDAEPLTAVGEALLRHGGLDPSARPALERLLSSLVGGAGSTPMGLRRTERVTADTPSPATLLGTAVNLGTATTRDLFTSAMRTIRDGGGLTATLRPDRTEMATETWNDGRYTSATALDRSVSEESSELAARGDGSVDASVCPDENGRIEAELRVQSRVGFTAPGVDWFAEVGLEMVVTAQLDERAEVILDRVEGVERIAAGRTRKQGVFVEARFGAETSGSMVDGSFDTSSITQYEITRTSANVDLESAGTIAAGEVLHAMSLARDVLAEIEGFWRSGACVEVHLSPHDGPDGLRPGSAVDIDVDATARLDGAPTGGVATVSLAGGGQAVAPTDARAVPATVTYTASRYPTGWGRVAAEVRSRRGIGTAAVELRNGAAWVVDSTWEGFHVTGTKCGGLAGTWQLQLSGSPGAGVAMQGALTLEVAETGTSGTYTFVGTSSAGGTTFSNTATGTVSVELQSDNLHVALQLTPTSGNVTNGEISHAGAAGVAELVATGTGDPAVCPASS